jgi:hypothetical protein
VPCGAPCWIGACGSATVCENRSIEPFELILATTTSAAPVPSEDTESWTAGGGGGAGLVRHRPNWPRSIQGPDQQQ